VAGPLPENRFTGLLLKTVSQLERRRGTIPHPYVSRLPHKLLQLRPNRASSASASYGPMSRPHSPVRRSTLATPSSGVPSGCLVYGFRRT
jgi:hypothetical protein